MFKRNFKVVVILSNHTVITHYMKGSRQDIKNDIEMYKNKSSKYEMFGRKGMIVWA